MSLTSTKAAVAAIAVAAAGIGAYWHYSPYLAMKSLREAAEARNAEAFNEKVDYPKLRESFKEQISAVVANNMNVGLRSGNEVEVLASTLVLTLIDTLLDAMVRPESVMKAMREGELNIKGLAIVEAGQPGEAKQEQKWDVERVSLNKVIAHAQGAKNPEIAKLGVVLERTGFADWKLTDMRIPTQEFED